MTGILNKALVKEAYDLVRPAIEAVFERGATGRDHLAIVVAGQDGICGALRETAKPFAESCLLVTSIGDLSASPWPNVDIALKKAELSARTGLPGRNIPAAALQNGDTVFTGSAVLEGIVVACAGQDPRHDEMFSWWIAAAVHAQVDIALSAFVDANPAAGFWTPQG